jgi:hypothetical protein
MRFNYKSEEKSFLLFHFFFQKKKKRTQIMTRRFKFLAYEGSSPTSPPNPNIPIHLNLNIKSDEQLVFCSNYKFNKDIIELLTPSKKSRYAKKYQKYGGGKPPKPPNTFVIYMRDKYNLPEFNKMIAEDRLPKIRDLWKRESKEIKEIFEACARIAKKWNNELYQGAVNYEEISSPNSSIPSRSNSPDTSSPSPSNSPAISSPTPFSLDTSSPSPSNPPANSSPSPISLDTSSPSPSISPAISSPSPFSLDTSLLFPSNSSTSFLESGQQNMNNNISSDLTELFFNSETSFPDSSSILTNFSATPYQYCNNDQNNNVDNNMLNQINIAQSNYLDTSPHHLTLDHNLPNLENINEELEIGNLPENARVEQPDDEYILLPISKRAYSNLLESNNNLYFLTEIYQKHTESNYLQFLNEIYQKHTESNYLQILNEIYQKHTESNYLQLLNEIYQKHTESNKFILSHRNLPKTY